MRRILLIVIALILYGSLYPWDFHARFEGVSPLFILLNSWPVELDRYMVWDVLINITLYTPLGVFAFLSMPRRAPLALRILGPLALGLTLSCSVEMMQIYDRGRVCSGFDVVSNLIGTALGIALGWLSQSKLRALVAREEAALRPSGALMLLCCWLGYQFFPLFPTWGRTALWRKLSTIGPLSMASAEQAVLVFVEWLTAACLVEAVFRMKTTRVMALLLLAQPLRLVIVGRMLDWPDVAGAVAGVAAWIWLPHGQTRRAMPAMLSAALILGELAPFHPGPSQRFHWVPFSGIIHSPGVEGFITLFRKSFWYGSAIWLWRMAGFGIVPVTAFVSVALFALELAQIYLPGRLPEITDGVLAALMGVMLWLLDPLA
jgi:VanZ family protein